MTPAPSKFNLVLKISESALTRTVGSFAGPSSGWQENTTNNTAKRIKLRIVRIIVN
jgi:hypothetical protein